MKARFWITCGILFFSGIGAWAEIDLGMGAAYESGNIPLSSVIPQVFAESIYTAGPWETFGIDFVAGVAPATSSFYTNRGLGAGPEIFFGTDLLYHFPRLELAEFGVLVGALGFQDYQNKANGVAAQTGLEATIHIGSFFVQGRGLYRFFTTTGMTGSSVPLGVASLAVLGGYSIF
jgi:hypothetical protein